MWGIGLKRYELEAFLKSFGIYFISLALLLTIVAYFYYKEGVHTINDKLKYEFAMYNYNFENPKFSLDFVDKDNSHSVGKLYFQQEEVFMLFPINGIKSNNRLKVIYPKSAYDEEINKLKKDVFFKYVLLLFILLVISFFYALYAIKPLKDAIYLLNEFLKDIIHDLNTPVSSLLLNIKMIRSNKSTKNAIDRIELSAKSIGELYKNLEYYIRNTPMQNEEFNITKVIEQRVEYFKALYPHINFELSLEDKRCNCSKEWFIRVVDNIISNSCKYNKAPYLVEIFLSKNFLQIKDSGVGIKNTKKVFKRYYKESQRGLGIGLNIVKKLCDLMNIDIEIKSKTGETVVTLSFKEGLI